MQSPQSDTRNVTDQYKGMSEASIVEDLDTRRQVLEIAVENLERDFNAGTIVRNANAFNVAKVHIIGRRQWNKRGAMATDRYMHVEYHASIEEFRQAATGKHIIGIDNIPRSVSAHGYAFPKDSVMVFGSEGPGLSDEMAAACEAIVAIEQFGSTRSINVGVASGIAMYLWLQQHAL